MGRGRAVPSVPGAEPLTAKPPAHAPGAFAPALRASAQHPTGMTSPAKQTAAANPGQQLLSQLQGQRSASGTGSEIGQQLLSMLQVQGNSKPASSETGRDAGQQLLKQLQGQAPARTPAEAELRQGLLQQLQSGGDGTASSQVFPQNRGPGYAPLAQTDAGRALLAQLQGQSLQAGNSAAQPMAQPVTQAYQGSGGNSASFEQLLRGAAATQRPMAQPPAQPMAQPAVQRQHSSNPAPSFNQLLRSAMAQQQPPLPPPGFVRRPHLPSTTPTASVATLAEAPGFAVSHQPPAQPQPAPSAMVDPGKLLLQQLQGGGLGPLNNALGQQPQGVPAELSHQQQGGPVQGGVLGQQPQGLFPGVSQQQKSPGQLQGSNSVGQMLLQQLQGATLEASAARVNTATGSDPAASVGAALDAPQPVPSAPPAPQSVLLQNAADVSASTTVAGTQVI